MVGVLAAVDGFDPARGTAFEPYATRYALGEMLALARQAAAVHVSRTGRDLARRRRGRRRGADRRERLGADHRTRSRPGPASTRSRSSPACAPGGRSPRRGRARTSCSRRTAATRTRSSRSSAGSTWAARLRALDERSQLVVALRFGLELSQAEIAERLGISQMHVSRLLRAALEQLWGDERRPEDR